jgi:hypothetical protein
VYDWVQPLFPFIAFATWLLVPLYAALQRGRAFAIFSAVTFAIALSGACVVHARLPGWLPASVLPTVDGLFLYGVTAAALHYAHLVRARLRGPVFRVGISAPGQAFVAASFMAAFWLLLLAVVRVPLWLVGANAALAFIAPLDVLPYAVGLVALLFSARPARELVRVRRSTEAPADFQRLPVERYRRAPPPPLDRRPLRLVQITDPHLGPWQSVERLRSLVEELVAREPDLVLLTGDFLTMESNASEGALGAALAPLRAMPGRCFATFGNHDHEAPDVVRAGLAEAGVTLLVDDAAVVETEVGPVEIIGADFVRSERDAHLTGLLERFPDREGRLRLLLLHDPSAFHDLPEDVVDLVLSGHTHGGQVGLVSFGLDWTVLGRSRWPDHGLFGRGRSRLYVHRGTGFYGFPLRVGVPGEASLLEYEMS